MNDGKMCKKILEVRYMGNPIELVNWSVAFIFSPSLLAVKVGRHISRPQAFSKMKLHLAVKVGKYSDFA